MKKWISSIVGLSFALACPVAAFAQAPKVVPPNILFVETDNIKAYNTEAYDKVAAEYPPVFAQLKATPHFLAMDSMTGSPRAMYCTRYDTFEAFQKDSEKFASDPAWHSELSVLDAREAPYVAESHNTLWHYRPDLSNNVEGADIPHTHYWEALIFHMHPGHDLQFDEMTKLYRDASVKSGQNVPWATFEALMGATDSYLVLVPMTSLKDEDVSLAHKQDFMAALGDKGMQQFAKLNSEGVATVEDNIWMVNPASSYVEKSWVDADPKYWAPKPAAKRANGAAPASKPPAEK